MGTGQVQEAGSKYCKESQPIVDTSIGALKQRNVKNHPIYRYLITNYSMRESHRTSPRCNSSASNAVYSTRYETVDIVVDV